MPHRSGASGTPSKRNRGRRPVVGTTGRHKTYDR